MQDAPPAARLAAKVAHELNNPLDAVLRFVSLAQRKVKTGDYADVERHLADAQFGLERMTEILRELMDVGCDAARPQPAALPALVGWAMRTISAQAEARRVAITVVNELPTRFAARFDARLLQVLSNLLRNAVDASPSDTQVRVSMLLASPSTVQVTIDDAGPGVAPAMLPKLFTPFVTTKEQGAGHGLGLAISREIVQALGGELSLENRPPAGCRASISLPVL